MKSLGELFTLRIDLLTNQKFLKEMKKTAYKAPEMDIIKLKANAALLSMSDGGSTDTGDSPEL